MKRKIEVFEYANEIMHQLEKGVLVTTKNGDRENAMTISWGMLGIKWNVPMFMLYVRENRFTRTQLDGNPEFTINIPYGEYDKRILGYCGTKSGHSHDKISDLKLTLEESESISVPGIRELPLTLECRVVYRQIQDRSAIPEDYLERFYPEDVDSSYHSSNRDLHIMYFGEIVNAYVIE